MAVQWVPDEPRMFNLGLRSRAVDHQARTVTLQLASDEALLTDYATLIEDRAAFDHQDSVRAIVDYVLGKIGAALAPGTPDPPFPVISNSVNVIPNGSFESDLTGWTASAGIMVRLTDWAVAGDANICHQPNLPGNPATFLQSDNLYTSGLAGATFRVTGTLRLTAPQTGVLADSARRIEVFHRIDAGGWTSVLSPPAPNAAGAYPVTVVVPLPEGTTEVYMRLWNGSYNEWARWDGVRMSEVGDNPTDTTYFDGDTPDTVDYGYAWTGTPRASTSTRTALVDRDPDILIWRPGRTAWDYLQPIVSNVGLRLFCDELRVWRLIDPGAYQVPGFVPVSPANATDAVDTISRDDDQVFATGVVVRYAWTDAAGVARTAFDAVGAPEKVVVFDYARPYPGPGTAAAILARRNGTGRTQDVSGLANWTATPGMPMSTVLPHAVEQLGKVTTVSWELDDSGLMQITAAPLIDVVEGSIDALDGSIDALLGTIDNL